MRLPWSINEIPVHGSDISWRPSVPADGELEGVLVLLELLEDADIE
jgi:hypothetical protein